MVFSWIIRQLFVANLWATIFIFEYHDISWIYEYEIECFKASLIIRRVNAWLRPYRMLTSYISSAINSLEHTTFSYIYEYLRDFVYYSFQKISNSLILVNNMYSVLFKSGVVGDILFFTEITFLRVKNAIVWAVSSEFGTKPCEWRTIPFQNDRKMYELTKHWIFQDHNFHDTHFTDTVYILDLTKTLLNGVVTFFKTLPLNVKKNTLINKYTGLVIVIIAFLTSVTIFYNLLYFSVFKNFGLQIAAVILLYILISTYFNFSKTYAVSKYTSQTQRFWKRTFGVFWGLEFTLFTIYMYLTLISPAELAMQAINHKEIITGLNVVKTSQYHLLYILVLIFLNFLYICTIILKKKNNFHFIRLFFFAINFAYCFILYYEFLKFYYAAGWGTHTVHAAQKAFTTKTHYSGFTYTATNTYNKREVSFNKIRLPNELNNAWNEVVYEKQWLRTFRHFLYVMLLLKFWHIFFIYVYFLLSLFKFLETGYISFDSISSNHQNTVYLIWFYLFSYLLVIKKKIYFFLTFIYYWTFVQINFLDFINMLANEFNFVYLF